jgi:hypothetical protein
MVGESSRNLASAAERFASDSVQVISQAADRAAHAASTSSDMATAASQAAAEARQAADSVTSAVNDAAEDARRSAQAAAQSNVEAAESMRHSMDSLNEAAARHTSEIEQAAVTAIESLNQSAALATERMAEDARILGEQLRSDISNETRELLEQLRATQGAGQDAVAAAQLAAQEARTAAADSQAHAERAQEVAVSPAANVGAQEVLERLEVDYELITRLVQELHERITSLTGHAPAPSGAASIASQLSSTPPEAEPGFDTVPPEPPFWYQDAVEESSFDLEPAGRDEKPFYHGEDGEKDKVAGRVLVTIAPVPDFDRLLNLDGALGRMAGVANVSLADYAKEEVTFRLEVQRPMTADDFARSLSESAGSEACVAAATDGKLALRLVS